MASTWIQYWKLDQIDRALGEGVVFHAYGDLLARVSAEDTVWILGTRPANQLVTIGNILVDLKTNSRATAARRLRERQIGKKWHIFAPEGRFQLAHEVSLMPLLEDLSFISNKMPHLNPRKAFGQQLRLMVRLTDDSALKLQQLWEREVDATTKSLSEIDLNSSDLDVGDRLATVKSRKEQQKLRSLLLGGAMQAPCFVCGKILPVNLLIASHIKPRSVCSDDERGDMANIAAMCALGCDRLFECGYITVVNGEVQTRLLKSFTQDLRRILGSLEGRSIRSFQSMRKMYLDWHADHHRHVARETNNEIK